MKHLTTFIFFLVLWLAMAYFVGDEEFNLIKELPKSAMMALFFTVVNYFIKKRRAEMNDQK